MEKINLEEKFSLFSEQWSPKIVGELNGQLVKLVKFKGPFVWHHHDHEDEMFLVTKGSFDMELADGPVTIREGEFIIIPRGVEHRPNAKEECEVVLFEPASTLNTGNVENERTLKQLQRL
jgi:mannose-6-phosphate isomerase-like protein (cupin superfamily)